MTEAYQDFITEGTKPVMLVDKNKMAIFDKHSKIMKALIGQCKTVKELHDELFFDQKSGEHSKTTKTVYRYMDELQEQGLVIVAGHRKPEKSRLTEKLYARSAYIYFQTDKENIEDYWETEKGCEIIKNYSNTISSLISIESDTKKINEIVKKIFQIQTNVINEILQEAGSNDQLSKNMMQMGMNDLKPFLSLITTFRVIREEPELITLIQNLYKKEE